MAKAKKAKVFLTDRAISDLQDIEAYTIEKWGDAQAAKYLDAFDRFFWSCRSTARHSLTNPFIDELITHSVESHVVVCTKWHDDVLVLTIVTQVAISFLYWIDCCQPSNMKLRR